MSLARKSASIVCKACGIRIQVGSNFVACIDTPGVEDGAYHYDCVPREGGDA